MNDLKLTKTRVEANREKFLLACLKIKNHKEINLSSLQRVIQPYAKTTLVNNAVFTFRLKGSQKNIQITYIADERFSPYFKVTTTNRKNLILSICALNTK